MYSDNISFVCLIFKLIWPILEANHSNDFFLKIKDNKISFWDYLTFKEYEEENPKILDDGDDFELGDTGYF